MGRAETSAIRPWASGAKSEGLRATDGMRGAYLPKNGRLKSRRGFIMPLRARTTAESFQTRGRNRPRLENSSMVWRVTA